MNFLKELHEGKMTRDANDKKILTFNDCCEKLYLILLTLEVMRHYPSTTPFIRQYSKNSYHSDYKHFKIGGTDLYNFIYFINGDEFALGKLKDPEAAKKIQASSYLPLTDIARYLSNIATGNQPTLVQQLFIRIENGLHINNPDYKEVRRNLVNYQKITSRLQKTVSTKLLYALRAKLRNSDIISNFSELISKNDLEKINVTDTEPIISKPDIGSISSNDIINYRFLTDSKNLLLIKAFLTYAQEGKSIPSNLVSAYMPIIKLIDDIVTAGPSYISMLKTLQKRAKKN